MARAFGVDIQTSDTGYWKLEDAELRAKNYASADPSNRFLLPFGLSSERGGMMFNCFRKALMGGLADIQVQPDRLWLVCGSGFILDVLHSIWPTTKYLIVQVGRKIWKEVLEGKNFELFVAPERFGDTAQEQPPYQTVPWYDAKLWQFVLRHGMDGDFIWNVAGVPQGPEAAVGAVLHRIELTRPR